MTHFKWYMSDKKDNICFIHIATIGNYQSIVDEILQYLMPSDFAEIYANIAGDGNVLLPEYVKQLPVRCSLDNFEFSTLNILADFAKQRDCNICYIHTKGASTGNNICIDEWRQYMLHFNLKNVSKITKILQECDTCGVDLVDTPVLHYSGNFWWSRSSHIAKLLLPRDLPTVLSERHKCEFWITSNEQGKYHTLHNSNIDVYCRHLTRYPHEMYEKNSH